MEITVIPHKHQLEAMVKGTFMQLLAKYVQDPTMVDIRKFITVGKKELRHYIMADTAAVSMVLTRAQCDVVSHDRYCIDQEDNKYFLYWLDHGQKRFGEEQPSLEVAIVEYLWREHGLESSHD